MYLNNLLDIEWRNNLRLIKISFNTPAFDRIIKDSSSKGTDILAAIGGTMGLLTGFSIISAVEILYFLVKFLWSFTSSVKEK